MMPCAAVHVLKFLHNQKNDFENDFKIVSFTQL